MGLHYTGKAKNGPLDALFDALDQGKGELLLLKAVGIQPIGRDEHGKIIPAQVPNGTLLKVLEVYPDGVKVATQAGEELEFWHAVGLRHLELAVGPDKKRLMDWPAEKK